MAKIAILGSGGFGTALAIMADKYDNEVTLWSAFENEIEAIRKDGEHRKLLPGVPVSPTITLTTDMNCVKNKDLIIIAVPSFVMRKICSQLKQYYDNTAVIASISKGLEEGSLKRLSEVIDEELGCCSVALSGPSHAEEVARGIPTTIVAGCPDLSTAQFVQDILMNEVFRIYSNSDIAGVEIGAALKNIIALAAGISDGIGLGDNTKAALMTRGLTEITRLGVALGAKSETFSGLSGIGDLIVTCTSMHSRNRRAGIFIGQGLSANDAIERVGMTVEGYHATKTAWELAKKVNINMPIVDQMYKILFENKSPQSAIKDLMNRPKKHESEQDFMNK